MQFPNRSDSSTRSDTDRQHVQGELHAKLPGTALCPPEKSHVIPPGPHSPTAQKPRNTNDPISKPETSSRELRAKLLGSGPCRPGGRRGACGAWPGNTQTPRPIGARRGACGAWPRCRWAAARPIKAGHAAAGDLAGRRPRAHRAATPKQRRHNRQRPGSLLHNSPHGSSPRRPRRICYDV